MTKEETLVTIRANGSSWVTYIYDELHKDVMGQYRGLEACTRADKASLKVISKIANKEKRESVTEDFRAISYLCENREERNI